MKQASHQGFTHIEVIPYDIIHPLTPRSLLRAVQSLAFILDHAPLVRDLCGTLYIWLVKPGVPDRPHTISRTIRSCSARPRSSSRATTRR